MAGLVSVEAERAGESLGIIAGSHSLPLEIARLARAAGVERLVAVAFEGETDPTLAGLVDEIVFLRVGQLSRLIGVFRDHGIRRCVMGGRIAPGKLFSVRPDLRAAALLWRLRERNARTIFGGIAEELEKDGIELIEATPWLAPIMPGAGEVLGRAPSPAVRDDLEFGMRIAKEVSRLEIGQSVVVKSGTVLAVEGFEGTDACLRRGGALAGRGGGARAVKVAREGHDMRYDIPCAGLSTVEICLESGIETLGLEARRVILLDRELIEKRLKRSRLSIAFLTP